MSELILHFGMHKTGSSAIQQALRWRDLGPRHANAAVIESANQSAAVIAMFSRNAHRHHNTVKRGLTPEQVLAAGQQQRQRFEALLREHPAPHLLLSAEDAGQLKPDDLRHLRRFAEACGRRVRAVAYVRTPASYMESALQQRIKGGLGHWEPSDWWPMYRDRFGKFDDVFGQDAVSLWKYEPAAFPDGDVVADFFRRLGVVAGGAPAVQRVNESLSLPAVRLLYAYRRFGPGYGVGSRAVRGNVMLIRKLGELRGPRLRLHRSVSGPVLQSHRNDLRWIEARLDAPMDDLPQGRDGLRSEADLLAFEPAEIAWLQGEANVAPPAAHPPRPEDVAQWMHRLRQRLLNQALPGRHADDEEGTGQAGPEVESVILPVSSAAAQHALAPNGASIDHGLHDPETSMNLKQLLAKAKGDDAALQALPEEAARKLVARAFREIRQRVARLEDRELVIGGLGTFRATGGDKEGAPGARRVEFQVLQRDAAPEEGAADAPRRARRGARKSAE